MKSIEQRLGAVDSTAHPTAIVLVFGSVGLLWLTFQVFEDTAWHWPFARGLLVLDVAAISLILSAFLGLDEAGGKFERKRAMVQAGIGVAAGAALVLDGVLVALQPYRSTLVEIACLGAGILLPLGLFLREQPAVSLKLISKLLMFGCLAGTIIHVISALFYLQTPYLEDIGQTTVDAIRAVARGANPYALALDHSVSDPNYQGYKYLPWMMATFAPLSFPFGATGLRITNLLLDLATGFLVARLARQNGGRISGLLAALIYLGCPALCRDVFMHGVTDLATLVPLLISLLIYEKKPFLSGLAVGLSISTKLFPGVAASLCLVPPEGRARYFFGLVSGLLPTLSVALISPSNFFDNIILFNLVRHPDSTSFIAVLPPVFAVAFRVLAVAILIGLCFRILSVRSDMNGRISAIVVAIVSVVLVGPGMHNNYMFWWLPFFCILLARAAARYLTSEAPEQSRQLI